MQIVFWVVYALMSVIGFWVTTRLDAWSRRTGLQIFWRVLGLYFGLLVLVLVLPSERGWNWTVTLTAPISGLVTAGTILMVTRRAGQRVAEIVGWNSRWILVPLFALPLLYLILANLRGLTDFFLHPFAVRPDVLLLCLFAAGAVTFLVLGLQKSAVYRLGTVHQGGWHVWFDFVSFHWLPVSKNETLVELVLVRKVWLNLLPNLRFKIRAADRDKVETVLQEYLPRTVSESAAAESS